MIKNDSIGKAIFLCLYLCLGACASIENQSTNHDHSTVSEHAQTNSVEREVLLQEVVVTGRKRTVEEPIADREIIPITENLYRARNNNHYSIFLVTSEGVILADPINWDFSEWLREEIYDRFDAEVKYVLYSHHHYDHASGGDAFANSADFVGHENMLKALSAPLPSTQIFADTNKDNIIQRSEAQGGTLANFDLLDRNQDNELSGYEMNVDIVPPNLTYTDSYSVYLGGMEVQMHHSGESHSNDGSIIFFVDSKVAVAVDWLNLNRLPGNLYGTSVDSWIESIDRVIALAPTRIAPGHGDIGFQADLHAYKQFFVDLQGAVSNAFAQGISEEEFAKNVELEDYQHWERYDSHLSIIAASAYNLAKP